MIGSRMRGVLLLAILCGTSCTARFQSSCPRDDQVLVDGDCRIRCQDTCEDAALVCKEGACHATTCGDSVVEGLEACDDGLDNGRGLDDCLADCSGYCTLLPCEEQRGGFVAAGAVMQNSTDRLSGTLMYTFGAPRLSNAQDALILRPNGAAR